MKALMIILTFIGLMTACGRSSLNQSSPLKNISTTHPIPGFTGKATVEIFETSFNNAQMNAYAQVMGLELCMGSVKRPGYDNIIHIFLTSPFQCVEENWIDVDLSNGVTLYETNGTTVYHNGRKRIEYHLYNRDGQKTHVVGVYYLNLDGIMDFNLANLCTGEYDKSCSLRFEKDQNMSRLRLCNYSPDGNCTNQR